MLNFTDLSLENKHIIMDHIAKFESYSDYNFASLFHWNVQLGIQFAFVGQALILMMTDYLNGQKFLTILSDNDIDEAIEACHQTALELGIDPTLRLVPEITVKNIKNTMRVTVDEDPDSHDYILDVDSLAEMRASVYRGKRNLLNRFHRVYGERTSAGFIDLNDDNNKRDMLALADSWRQHTTQVTDDTINEFNAIERSIHNSHHLQIRAFGVFIDDKLEAFSIIEDLPESGLMLHFDKANREFAGIYEFLKNELALHVQREGKKWINFQQDLGIEGLRFMKESYKPIKKLKKHTVRLNV